MPTDLYTILNVSKTASQQDIKAAYRRLAIRYHPDISQEADCKERFAQISAAYEILSDPAARAAYDIRRASPLPPPTVHQTDGPDPIYELLRRHREHAQYARSRFGAGTAADWQERKVFWEKEKQEAAEYKARRQRLHSRMHQAHTARVAKALASQWPASTGVTRHDVAAMSIFATGCALMSFYWLGRSDDRADNVEVVVTDEGEGRIGSRDGRGGQDIDCAAESVAPGASHGDNASHKGSAWPQGLLDAWWPDSDASQSSIATAATQTAAAAQQATGSGDVEGAQTDEVRTAVPSVTAQELGRARLRALESALRAETAGKTEASAVHDAPAEVAAM